ncbi:4-(cytidine 5'-diphospho)-2-C-methyl-D-erythritol kinase [Stappia sp. ICDLI1TA098]
MTPSCGGNPPQFTTPDLARLARAKVNYALHVTGRREDGYHLIESLVAFPRVGDKVALVPAGEAGATRSPLGGMALSGRFSDALEAAGGAADNLVLRAAEALLATLETGAREAVRPFLIRLEKNLPVAAGIGGGSADAAATLLLLRDALSPTLPDETLLSLGERLGADVPMCISGRPALVAGIGERIAPLPGLPAHALVLVNPGVPVATPAVFSSLARRDNPPLPSLPQGGFATLGDLCGWCRQARNDLEAPALRVAPQIAGVLERLADADGVHLARMSGSGATCFAILDNLDQATRLARDISRDQPDWWVVAAPVD